MLDARRWRYPTDVVRREDGNVLVSERNSVVCVRDGVAETLVVCYNGFSPLSLAYFPALGDGVYVSESRQGSCSRAFQLVDALGLLHPICVGLVV